MTAAIDHRDRQSAVRDQGQRPICTAYAVASAHESASQSSLRSVEDVLWAAHQVGADQRYESVHVSEALVGLEAHAHASEVSWPVGHPHFTNGRPESAARVEDRCVLPDWSELRRVSVESVAEALTSMSAVVLTIGFVAQAWYRAAQSGVIDSGAGEIAQGSHAVAVVGATALRDELIVKNSWGPGWADGGYARMTVAYLDRFAIAAHAIEQGA